MKGKILLIGLLVLAIGLSGCTEVLDDPEAECERVDGVWKTFSNTCVDSCRLARFPQNTTCGAALTDGCECGPNKCWEILSGSKKGTCVPN